MNVRLWLARAICPAGHAVVERAAFEQHIKPAYDELDRHELRATYRIPRLLRREETFRSVRAVRGALYDVVRDVFAQRREQEAE